MMPHNNLTTNPKSEAAVAVRARRILLVIGIVIVAANLRASITSVGPLIGAIHADMGLSSDQVGLLTTLPLLAFAALSPIAPKIARRLGMELTLLASLVVLLVGIILRSLPSMAALFTGTTLLGLAIAIGNVLLPSLIKRDFPTKVGLMIGVYSTSMGILASIASGVSVPLEHGLEFGWRGSLAFWAVLSVVAIVIWLPQLRKARQPHDLKVSKQEFGEIWKSSLAWQVTLFMGLQSILFYVSITWLPEILQSHGMSAVSAGWMLFLMQFIGLPATLIVPLIAGRLSNQRVLAGIIAAFGVVGFTGLFIDGSKLVLLWVVLVGVTLGASISLALTLLTLRTRNAHQASELSGMAQSVGYLLAAIGPVLFGYLHDLTRTWSLPLLTLIVVSILLIFIGLGAGQNAYVTRN